MSGYFISAVSQHAMAHRDRECSHIRNSALVVELVAPGGLLLCKICRPRPLRPPDPPRPVPAVPIAGGVDEPPLLLASLPKTVGVLTDCPCWRPHPLGHPHEENP